MRAIGSNDDTHFYVDNAPPEEVSWVLRCLSNAEHLSPQMIADKLYAEYGFVMQQDKTYSPRRLYDLGLAYQSGVATKIRYNLSELGARFQSILALDQELYIDLMHFLHYTRYNGKPETRKYLWSYRQCCEIVWAEGRAVPVQELASNVQSLMRQEFPDLDFGARKGARFDSTAAGRFYRWIRELVPPPFPDQDNALLSRRTVSHYELALLSLDHVYQARGYRYGDPVVLDEVLLDELARVFFLEHHCFRNLLSLAAKMTRSVVLHDTFAGTSVKLMAPYGVEDV